MTSSPSSWQAPDANKVKSLFSQVAGGYDKANQVLSVGIHHLWRKKLVQKSLATPESAILDCATGTGDVAIAFKSHLNGKGHITGIDFCPEMLSFAPEKSKQKGYTIDFKVADVTQLFFEDNLFDIVTISFGIRNVNDPVKAIAEMTRVLKPGGRLLILEFGQVKWPIIDVLYQWYSQKLLPKLGGLITGHPEAYRYLQDSSARFPSGSQFAKLLEQESSLSEVEYWPLQFGIAYLYRGIKKPFNQ